MEEQGRAVKTGEALFSGVSEVDPYQESSPALPRALSKADRFTAWRLAVASPRADRQAGRKAQEEEEEEEKREEEKLKREHLSQKHKKDCFEETRVQTRLDKSLMIPEGGNWDDPAAAENWILTRVDKRANRQC